MATTSNSRRVGQVVSRSGRVYILQDLQARKFRAESDTAWASGRWVLVLDGVIVGDAGNVTPAVVVEG